MRMVTITRYAELSVFRFQNRPYWYAKKWLFDEGKWGVRSTAVPVASPKSLAARAARSMLAAGAFDKPHPERMLIPFLKTFWGEAYPADRKAQGRPLSAAYTANCLGKIKNYIDAYAPFAGLTLDGLTVDALEKWRTWLSGRGLSARGINICLQCVKARWADIEDGLIHVRHNYTDADGAHERAGDGDSMNILPRTVIALNI
jgi:hypothetical protein